MGKSGSGKVLVSDYYMSLHFGVCTYGEGLQLLDVKVGDKIAWEGQIADNNVYLINRPSLFGGVKKEGGLNGLLWWLNGNPEQRLPAALAERLGKSETTCPGYRGFASFFLTGQQTENQSGLEQFWTNYINAIRNGMGSSIGESIEAVVAATRSAAKGFWLASNNPYLKTVSARVRRAPIGLNPATALVNLPNSSTGRQQRAANPAHIVFEAMTNQAWGMGESFGAFNIATFEDCAQTLFTEGFGLCLQWTRQGPIEDFIREVLDHVQGAVYVDPATGKHTMKLLRGDYDPATLPKVTPDNAKIISRKRVAWGETANEVVVTWTDPETSKEATVVAQDLAAIAAQGATISTSRNYHGVASQALAQRLAERDLAAVVHPLMTMEIEVSRAFWKTVLYDVIEVTWPEIGIESAIFRVSKVSAGSQSHTIKMSLYEDVFSLDMGSYLTTATTGWVNPSQAPAPLENYYIGTAPAFMHAAIRELEDPGQINFPDAMSLIVAAPNSGNDISMETTTYARTVVGEERLASLGDRPLNASWTFTTGLGQVARSTIDRPSTIGRPPQVGDFVVIGNSDNGSEICVIRSVSAAFLTLDRGLLDTTPKTWPAGARAYVIPENALAVDKTLRAIGEVAKYHLRPQTSLGRLSIADAPLLSNTLTNRAIRPLRPANVKVGGTAFGTHNMGSATSVAVTWSNRNRADESTQALLWTDAGVAPEAGQTTRIKVLRASDRVLLTTISDLTGESYTLQKVSLATTSPVILQVLAVKDGRESLQAHEITVTASF